MSKIGASFNQSIFRTDNPMIIATNRGSAVMLPVRLSYDIDGYPAGQVLARNTTSGLYAKYDGGGASGTDVAAAILFEPHPVEDFDPADSSGSTMAVGIFGGCTLYQDKLVDLDSDAIDDIGAKSIIDASGVKLLKF